MRDNIGFAFRLPPKWRCPVTDKHILQSFHDFRPACNLPTLLYPCSAFEYSLVACLFRISSPLTIGPQFSILAVRMITVWSHVREHPGFRRHSTYQGERSAVSTRASLRATAGCVGVLDHMGSPSAGHWRRRPYLFSVPFGREVCRAVSDGAEARPRCFQV